MTDKQTPDRPAVEKALRECGLSARQAKKLLSGGWKLLSSEEEQLLAELDDLKVRFSELLSQK
ncbi:MAG: hypothetical protein HY273_14710 [Gammaproteobacteria bacterium]|nr:hypothetical protein [Gammaproteobacteria bacterium]